MVLVVILAGCRPADVEPTFQRNKIVMVINNKLFTYDAIKPDQTPNYQANKYFVPKDTAQSHTVGETWLNAERSGDAPNWLQIRLINTCLEELPLPYTFVAKETPKQYGYLDWGDQQVIPFNDTRCYGPGDGCRYSGITTTGSLKLTITTFNGTFIQGTFSGKLSLGSAKGFNRFTDESKVVDVKGTFFIEYKREISNF